MVSVEKEKSYTDVETLYAFLNVLKIASNTNDFRQWVRKNHNVENDDHLFVGYQLFLDAIICQVIHSFERHSSFGIKSDYSIYRASFVGVNIDDIPITSDEVKVLKNLWNHYRSLRDCNNWTELEFQMKEKNNAIFSIFDKIFAEAIESKTKIPKEDIVWRRSLFWTLVYLNDTRQGHPLGYPGTILDSFIDESNYDHVFFGYVCSLEYLWSRLLNENDFTQSSASKIHEAITPPKTAAKKLLGFFSENSRLNKREVWNRWQELDKYFSRINNEIIKKRYPSDIRQSELRLTENFDPAFLEPLFHLSKISEPDYLIKRKSFKSWSKFLDSFFFWHDMDILDTNKIHVFNGAFAFIPLLVGEVEKYKMFGVTDPIWIARIKHPVGKEKNDISYGILLQSGGWISDSSGWLLFLDCGNDFSGSGGYQHEQVEEFVTKYEKSGIVTVKEISVSSDLFVRYLQQKDIPSLIRQIKAVTTEIIDNSPFDADSISPQTIVLNNLQQFNDENIDEISNQIEKITFFLKIFIPDDQKNHSIREKIDRIDQTENIAKKLEIIGSVLPLIPYIIENDRFDLIESKLDELKIRLSPGPSSKIVISSGIEFLGTGAKHEFEIPLSDISYDELSEDLKRFIQHPNSLLKYSPRLREKIFNYFK